MTAEFINQLFTVVLIPLLGVLTTFFVKWVNAKAAQLTTETDNAITQKYINMLSETITSCVIATNQTYVDSLKQAGAFDAEAQQEAFAITCTNVMNILSAEAKKYLTNAFGDLETYINEKIEAEVKTNKITPVVTPAVLV